MKAFQMSWGDEEVEVDACSECHGLWLDADEGTKLKRVLDHAALADSTQVGSDLAPPGILSYVFQIGVFVQASGGPEAAHSMLKTHGLIPSLFLSGRGLSTLLTHAFLHSGLFHLLGNLYFLYVFGDNIEDTLGKRAFATIYGLAALSGALLHVFTHPASTVPMVGASGAISGLMGAYLVLFPRVKVWVVFFFMRFRLGVIWYLGIWVLLQVGLVQSGQSRVAAFAHLGGFGAGMLLGLLGRKKVPALAPR
jgi:membrane associated rhomboid family serine protease